MKKIFTYALMLATLLMYSCRGSESETTSDTETTTVETDTTEVAAPASEEDNMKNQLKEVMGANAGEESVLEEDDIARFKTSVAPMSKAFQELGDDKQGGTPETMEAFLADEKIVAVLEKHGWEKETFGPKFTAITLGVAYLTIQEQMEQVPEDQRGQMQQLMAAQMKQYEEMLHKDDLELLSKDIEALREAMEKAQ